MPYSLTPHVNFLATGASRRTGTSKLDHDTLTQWERCGQLLV